MCVEVIVYPERKHISTVGDIRSLCGFAIPERGPDDALEDRFCLCPVNVSETLVQAGFKVWRSELDSMWYECERLPAVNEE